jgi:hypothetical protein
MSLRPKTMIYFVNSTCKNFGRLSKIFSRVKFQGKMEFLDKSSEPYGRSLERTSRLDFRSP